MSLITHLKRASISWNNKNKNFKHLHAFRWSHYNTPRILKKEIITTLTWFVPMSMTTAPFFSQLPRTMFGIPTSVTLSVRDSLCTHVTRWPLRSASTQKMTNQPLSNWNILLSDNIYVTCNSKDVGNPAILLQPSITALFPLISTPCLSNNSMQPLGAQGIKKGFLLLMARFPIFKGWNPSTSFSSGLTTLIIFSSSKCCTKHFRITY